MYDTSPNDDLQNLEIEFCKLSELFYKSINDLKNYAPFVTNSGEENLEKSNINTERVQFEQIPDYEEKKNNYTQLVEQNATQMNTLFDNIGNMIHNLTQREEFKSTDTELNNKLKDLKESNDQKALRIKEKINYIEGLVNRVKTDNDINTQINKKENDHDLFDDLEL